MTDRLYTLPEDFARRHATDLRDFASLFVLAEMDGSNAPTPKQVVRRLEAMAREFERTLSPLEPTTDPAPMFRAAGCL
jgi:hypothetical protein